MNKIVRGLAFPVLAVGYKVVRRMGVFSGTPSPSKQDLDVYWTPHMLQSLETWGAGTAWDEIQYLMAGRRGKALDIACGTAKVMEVLSRFPALELHGCDISDALVARAYERGFGRDRVRIMDATKLEYRDGEFDYSYSIGSFEHFTEEGIAKVIAESARVTRGVSFHHVPVSLSGEDEGWIKVVQSYYNNSPDWWRDRFLRNYSAVHALESRWSDFLSRGMWFVCEK